MPRLGEHLVAARILDPEQVERALRAQVVWGGRLGTNLIELGLLDLESISRALGRQHNVPAALARHFEKADRELQERLPAELAEQWSVVPLLHVGPQKQKIAIAVIDPLPADALAAVADALLCAPTAMVVSIAPEMRVRYHLERLYGITRAPRFLRSRSTKRSGTPFPQFDNVPVPVDSDAEVAVPIAVDETTHPTGRAAADRTRAATDAEPVIGNAPTLAAMPAVAADVAPAPVPEPVALARTAPAPASEADDADEFARLIDEAIDEALSHATAAPPEPPEPPGRDRRTYVRTLADPAPPPPPPMPSTEAVTQPLARLALKRVATAPTQRVAPTGTLAKLASAIVEGNADTVLAGPATLLEAIRAIRRASNRERVADLVIDALERFVPAAEAAVLLFVRGDVAISWKSFSRVCSTTGDIAVPLDQPGLVPTVIERNAVARAGVAELGPIDEALLRSISDLRGDLVIVPIAIADRVMGLIATATASDAPVEAVASVAAAAAAAVARLIRDASR